MEQPPVLFLAFSNSTSDHLDMLKAEGAALKSALRPLEQRGFIRVEKEESTTTDELIELLASYKDQLLIFHYGGHANEALLALENQAAQAEGIAKLLGEQENLKLVFLNGCSTKKQVELLFKAGVKAVIATSVPINDQKAKRLATAFYQALANKRTIKRAFEFAKSALESEFKDAPEMNINKGFHFSSRDSVNLDEIPWGLYVQPEFEKEILQWHLPYYAKQGLPETMIRYIGEQFEVNLYIVMVLEEMGRYNPDIYHKMTEVRDGEEKRKDSSTFLDLVIENFPWVIGSQLRLLLIHNQPNRERIEQLLSTYLVTVKVLYFILLANFRKELASRKENEKKKILSNFAKENILTEENALSFDFLQGIKKLYKGILEMGGQLFVPEFVKLCENLEGEISLKEVYEYLKDLQTRYTELSEAEMAQECLDAEEAVSVVLQNAAFLANYHMLTVRNINIENPLHSTEAYELDLGRLNAVVNTSLRLYDDSEYRRKDTYTNCRSIVLVPNEDDFHTFLNLSPFIIDKNTYLNNSAIDLFLYAFEKEDHYHYLSVNHSIFQAFTNEKGTDVIHTGMTDTDFQEGRNIQRSARKSSRFGGQSRINAVLDKKQGKKIFTPLEGQFEYFKTEFGFK